MKKTCLYATLVATVLSMTTPMAAFADVTDTAQVSAVIEVNAFDLNTEETDEGTQELTEEETAAAAAEQQQIKNQNVRQDLVQYALQFVGGRYRAGGNDPNTGADCSGFVRYVMQNGAGVSMNRSSTAQSSQGVQISASQMQPGDLLFYGSGSRINHVAMYIGDGQIVHASTYSTGIKTSPWNYRTPVRIMNVLG